ncbi:MAG TPA: hypothetical protein VFO07_05465, partial [Roseiflexaceae bacterium]|nr:hypothetical protein [Roseiflexaceae bacterium]
LAEGLGLLALALLLILLFFAAYDSVIVGAAPRSASVPRAPTARPAAASSMRPTPDPFPASDTITETIESVLAAYNQAQLQAGAGARPVPVQSTNSLIYLSHVAGPQPTAAPGPEPTPTPSPTPRPEPPPPPADVAVTLWPAPSIRVARDGTLAYEMRVRNYGDGAAEQIQVRLPYDRQRLTVTSSKFNDPSDWVSELKDDHVTVTFGRLSADKSRTATIFFRVNRTLPDNTVLTMRASYTWNGEQSDGHGSSNWAPVLVGGGNDSAPWVWVQVDPFAGRAGTTHHFFSDRFIPGEGVVTWLNTPDGVKPLDLRGVADPMGRIWLDFKSSGLRPASYQIVLYGARSNLTGVASFNVQ